MTLWQRIGIVMGAALLALGLYAADGYRDALRDGPRLKSLAQSIIDDGRGPASLNPWQLDAFLSVNDPPLHGSDRTANRSGRTSASAITQSLAKRLAFKDYQPGIGKIRQTAYALALEDQLSGDEILALALDLAPIGDRNGQWVTGVHAASQAFFSQPVTELERRDYLSLVAVMIAPGNLSITTPDAALDRRVLRIERLLRGECAPTGRGDIWLDGCSTS